MIHPTNDIFFFIFCLMFKGIEVLSKTNDLNFLYSYLLAMNFKFYFALVELLFTTTSTGFFI